MSVETWHRRGRTRERREKKDDERNDKFLVWRQRRPLLLLPLRWPNDAFPLHTRTIQLFLPHACVFMCACANASERVYVRMAKEQNTTTLFTR